VAEGVEAVEDEGLAATDDAPDFGAEPAGATEGGGMDEGELFGRSEVEAGDDAVRELVGGVLEIAGKDVDFAIPVGAGDIEAEVGGGGDETELHAGGFLGDEATAFTEGVADGLGVAREQPAAGGVPELGGGAVVKFDGREGGRLHGKVGGGR
jgi:hypothetical protein